MLNNTACCSLFYSEVLVCFVCERTCVVSVCVHLCALVYGCVHLPMQVLSEVDCGCLLYHCPPYFEVRSLTEPSAHHFD